MKKKIGSLALAAIAVIAVIAGVEFFIAPGFISSFFLTFGEATPLCSEAPYNPDCICPSDDNWRRVDISWTLVGNRYRCENLDWLILDPESPTFEDDSIQFAKDYLNTYCGDICTDLECGEMCILSGTTPADGSNRCMDASWGVAGTTGERLVNIECREVTEWETTQTSCSVNEDCNMNAWFVCHNGLCGRPSSGVSPWRMEFYVESETGQPVAPEVLMWSNYCIDPAITTRCAAQCAESAGSACVEQLPITSVPNDAIYSIFNTFSIGSGWPAPI